MDLLRWNLMFLWVILALALFSVLIVSVIFIRKLLSPGLRKEESGMYFGGKKFIKRSAEGCR